MLNKAPVLYGTKPKSRKGLWGIAIFFAILTVFGLIFSNIQKTEKPLIEGVDFSIEPDSIWLCGSYVVNPSAGDTVWIEKYTPKSTKKYETDPMWREVQRAVDNDPYFKQW